MDKEFVLRLYIAGQSPRSIQALENLRAFCKEYLSDNYDLEVIDIVKNPITAISDGVFSAPILLVFIPPPLKRIDGDLSDTEQLLRILGLKQGPEQ